ncbi:hypothetical protein [Deinococcus fonticola]|uniref:hypothetical protein n=1 Tax=Deinococcus fonticola TaxID=2528713 RepID=UPI0010757056|nr:hypothetical protein [Deinococcus fonticola]
MKKFLPLVFLTFSMACAQSWTVEGPFRDELLGCQRVGSGQVQCSIKSTYTGSGPTYYGATYYARDTAAYAPDRRRFIASRTTIDGRDVTNATLNVAKANPVTVVYTLDYPAQFDKITMLFVDSGILKEVPIKGGPIKGQGAAQPATPKPAAPAAQPAQAAPAAQPPAAINLNAFDISLTGCTLNAKGGYTCTKAEINPKR